MACPISFRICPFKKELDLICPYSTRCLDSPVNLNTPPCLSCERAVVGPSTLETTRVAAECSHGASIRRPLIGFCSVSWHVLANELRSYVLRRSRRSSSLNKHGARDWCDCLRLDVNSDIFNDQTRRNQINLELNQCGSKRDVSWPLKLKTMTNRNLPSTTMISNADRWSRDTLDRWRCKQTFATLFSFSTRKLYFLDSCKC